MRHIRSGGRKKDTEKGGQELRISLAVADIHGFSGCGS